MRPHRRVAAVVSSLAGLALLVAGGLAPWLTGCAARPRFRDQPVVWSVDDRADIAQPETNEYLALAYFADVFAMRRFTRFLELRDREPAHNTNALDEVPDSTWFTNRIGARPMTPAEAAVGPAASGPPRPPLTVTRSKDTGGGNPGFFARDETGRVFLVKFDTKDNPEMQTATSVIVNRIFFALGYNVPSDTVFTFRREELRLAPDAQAEDDLGRRVPMSEAHVDAILAQVPRLADGRYRASASELLEGVPVGGFSPEGTRRDDPNDVVPHEHRRELRALRVFAAWLGHTDVKMDNTLDMYVEEDGRRFLRHYLLDFGEALGAHQAEKQRLEDGWENAWDWRNNGLALLSLGLWRRPWEDQVETPWPAVGAFSDEWFEPELWRPAYPYWPFAEADAADLYWGAKLVMHFDRPLLEAIVAEGRLEHPAAAEHLVDALMGRRERIGHAWLEAVSPLDYFSLGDDGLCMVDVAIRFGIATDGVVERLALDYRPDLDDLEPEVTRPHEEFRATSDGSVCLPLSEGDGYVVDRLRVRRGREFRPLMQVHYIAGDEPRLLGIIRVEP
jgi:hypothetical protein